MPILKCPICKGEELEPPMVDCSTKRLLCEPCSESIALELREMAIQNIRDLGEDLVAKL